MYKINYENLKKEKNFYFILFAVCFVLFLILTSIFIPLWTEDIYNSVMGLVVAWFSTGIGMYLGWSGMKETNKKKKKYEYLAQNGELKKGLPYRLEPTGNVVNGVRIMQIVVDYDLSSGSQIKLYGDERRDYRFSDCDGLVDVLIDPNDTSKYYIDFEIETIY